MSGFEVAAAFVGVADVTFRSVCSLYDFIDKLIEAPIEIKEIKNEISVFRKCLEELSSVQQATEETCSTIRRMGLPGVVADCDEACEELLQCFRRWEFSESRWTTRLQFRWRSKKFERVVTKIRIAKGTVLLTLLVAQLYD